MLPSLFPAWVRLVRYNNKLDLEYITAGSSLPAFSFLYLLFEYKIFSYAVL